MSLFTQKDVEDVAALVDDLLSQKRYSDFDRLLAFVMTGLHHFTDSAEDMAYLFVLMNYVWLAYDRQVPLRVGRVFRAAAEERVREQLPVERADALFKHRPAN